MKKFFRQTNVFRLLGLVMIIGGAFLPTSEWSGLGIKGNANLIQVVGCVLLIYPMIKELFIKRGEK